MPGGSVGQIGRRKSRPPKQWEYRVPSTVAAEGLYAGSADPGLRGHARLVQLNESSLGQLAKGAEHVALTGDHHIVGPYIDRPRTSPSRRGGKTERSTQDSSEQHTAKNLVFVTHHSTCPSEPRSIRWFLLHRASTAPLRAIQPRRRRS